MKVHTNTKLSYELNAHIGPMNAHIGPMNVPSGPTSNQYFWGPTMPLNLGGIVLWSFEKNRPARTFAAQGTLG